ncbi:MAG: magnesium transporter [Bacteroidota bacterium]
MLKELLKPEIQELIESRQWSELREVLATWPAPEIADLLLDNEKHDRVLMFRSLPRALSTEVFSYLEPDQQDALLEELTDAETREILASLSPDDRTSLLEELPAEITQRLLNLLNPDDLKEARQLLGYPEGSIGRMMTPDFVMVRPDWTIKRALAHIRKFGKNSETINRIYVRDISGKLVDDIMLRNIILAEEDDTVESLMDFNVVSLSAFDEQEEAVRTLEKYDIPAIPVVDSEGYLIGIVTFDDVMDVAQEEATEDIQRIGGVEALDEPYMSTPFLKLIQKRAGWLIVLLFGEMLTTTALGFFEHELDKAVILSLFLPLIISSGGNSGSQATTLIIRALALGEIRLRDWWRILRKEILVSLVLGLILGVIGFLRIEAWSLFSDIYGIHSFLIALTVGISLVGVVMWGSICGSMMPFILKKLKFDPATASAPFVATVADVVGLVIYFLVAISILRGTLL